MQIDDFADFYHREQRAVAHLAYWRISRRPTSPAGWPSPRVRLRRHLARARQKLRTGLRTTAAEAEHDARSMLGGTR